MGFNLDELAAARAEALADGETFTFRDTEFTLPPPGEFTWSDLELLDADLRAGLTKLLGGMADKFWEFEPTIVEVSVLRDQLIEQLSGAMVGESSASHSSSNRAGRRARQRSQDRTQASAKAPSE